MVHFPGTIKASAWLLLVAVAAGCAKVKTGRTYQHSTIHQTSAHRGVPLPLAEEEQMYLQYCGREGEAALECERVVLVFHGISAKRQRLFHFQGQQQAVQIAGQAGSSVSVTCTSNGEKVAFQSNYTQGTNTLEFFGTTVRFTHGGRLLLAGDQTIDLSAGRKIVHLKDGKVVVE
jgi:hypothetical protein